MLKFMLYFIANAPPLCLALLLHRYTLTLFSFFTTCAGCRKYFYSTSKQWLKPRVKSRDVLSITLSLHGCTIPRVTPTPSIPHPHPVFHTQYTSPTHSIPHPHPVYHTHIQYTTPTPSIPHPHPVYHTHTQYTTPTPSIPHPLTGKQYSLTVSHTKRGYTFLVHNSASLKWRSSCTLLLASTHSSLRVVTSAWEL